MISELCFFNAFVYEWEYFNSFISLDELTIGPKVNSICPFFCQYNTKLSSLIIPGNVKTIGRYAFDGAGVKKVVFKEGVEIIDQGAFAYSEEEGTYAALNFADSIPQEEKQRRLDALMEIQRSISSGFNNSRIGSVVRVMVDDRVGDTLVCRSEFESPEVDGEILVKLKDEAQSVKIGDFITVKIVSADDYDLTAEIVEKK